MIRSRKYTAHSVQLPVAIGTFEDWGFCLCSLQGYHKCNAFIATQGPLPDTTDDFWRMIYEKGCATIVMLTKVKESGRMKCHRYWPQTGAETYGRFQVIVHATNEYPGYILRELKVVDTRVSCPGGDVIKVVTSPFYASVFLHTVGWLLHSCQAVPVHRVAGGWWSP